MKTVFLIRHAKSDWSIDTIMDIDRPLNARGYADANKMSNLLKEEQVVPNLIITSPAIRALSTAIIFARNFNYNPKNIFLDSNLYEATISSYSTIVSRLDEKNNCVFIFGHNPTISDFAASLCTNIRTKMTTCAIVGISKNVEKWEQFISVKSKNSYYNYPKNHFL